MSATVMCDGSWRKKDLREAARAVGKDGGSLVYDAHQEEAMKQQLPYFRAPKEYEDWWLGLCLKYEADCSNRECAWLAEDPRLTQDQKLSLRVYKHCDLCHTPAKAKALVWCRLCGVYICEECNVGENLCRVCADLLKERHGLCECAVTGVSVKATCKRAARCRHWGTHQEKVAKELILALREEQDRRWREEEGNNA